MLSADEISREKLAAICEETINEPSLLGRKGTTYCNIAVQRISEFFGFHGFRGLLANDMYKVCLNSDRWSLLKIFRVDKKTFSDCLIAQSRAMNGNFVVAAKRGSGNGHIAVVYPGKMAYSGKWGEDVPLVANVGKKNGIMGANYAFKERPEFFIWNG